MSQLTGEAMIVGLQGLVAMGVLLFLHSLWRDLAHVISGKDHS